ncbi:MAG TPA: hypothetical protein VFM45_02140, partial [Anaeromyxobacteraceae bacterium]|nr:hypothetical protein [Anaeromyxobacteraceae bacterium]
HAPQFSGSVWRFLHPPPQDVSPAAHVAGELVQAATTPAATSATTQPHRHHDLASRTTIGSLPA